MTTLTTLIYMKSGFITDYADYADISGNMENSFITEFADHLVFNTRCKIMLSLTTLTTLILETYMQSSFITNYADYADIHDNM